MYRINRNTLKLDSNFFDNSNYKVNYDFNLDKNNFYKNSSNYGTLYRYDKPYPYNPNKKKTKKNSKKFSWVNEENIAIVSVLSLGTICIIILILAFIYFKEKI